MGISSRLGALALSGAARSLALIIATVAPPSVVFAAEAAARPSADPSLLSEVVVTAQKREENLQKVPLAITAYTAQLRDKTGLVSAQDQLNFTPGVTFQPPSSSDPDRITIRGIGRVTNQIGTDGGVAVYQDGFYVGSSTGLGGSTLGVDRIEVLRGPQGTLYGRNSIGGAVNVISRKPDSKFTADVRVTGNEYGGETVEGRISGPITDHIRASAWVSQNDQSRGYYHDVLPHTAPGAVPGQPLNLAGSVVNESLVSHQPQEGGTGHGWSSEFQLAFDAGSSFDGGIRFVALDQYSYPRDSTGVNGWGSNVALIVPNVFTGFAPQQNPGIYDHRAFYTNTPTKDHMSNDYQVIGHLNWHLSGIDVKYTGGYWQYTNHLDEDGDSTANIQFQTPVLFDPTGFFTQTSQNLIHYVFNDTQKSWSHEVTFASTGNGPLQWIGGVYYYNEAHEQTFAVPEVGEPHYDQLTDYLFTLNPAVAGLYASIEPNFYGLGPSGPINNPKELLYSYDARLKTQSEALFAQVDWRPTDHWHISLGARYSWDQKAGFERQFSITQIPLVNQDLAAILDAGLQATPLNQRIPGFQYFWPKYPGTNKYVEDFVFEGCQNPGSDGVVSDNPAVGPCPAHRNMKNNWSAPTGTFAVEWSPNRDTNVYGRYSRGYKSGGYNLGTLAPGAIVNEETIDAFEGGWKQNFGPTFQVNAAAFYYLYHGIQALNLTVVQDSPPIGVNELVNVPESRAFGVELETKWAPIDNLLLMFNYSYLDTQILKGAGYVDSSDPAGLQPGAKPFGPGLVDPVTNAVTQRQTLVGNQLPESPNHKISVNASYTWKFAPGDLTFSVTEDWHSSFYYTLFDNPNWRVPGGQETSLRLGWAAKDRRYEVIAQVSNLFNAEVPVSVNTLPPNQAYYHILGLEPPRVVTLELRAHF